MSRRTYTVEVLAGDGFGALIEARERVRKLVLEFDPEAQTWGGPRRPSHGDIRIDRTLALALMGVHDLIEESLNAWIEDTGEMERLRTPSPQETEPHE